MVCAAQCKSLPRRRVPGHHQAASEWSVDIWAFFLICHKSMLSAAALIAQAQPEDSVYITRRAVEAGRVALAIKLNDENALQ